MRCHHKNNFNHRFSNLFQAHSSKKICIIVHPSEEPCTPSTYFHHLTCVTYDHAVHMRRHHKKISIIDFQTYSKHIPPRSHVSKYILRRSHVPQVHTSKELCIPNTSFREAMYSKGVLSSSHLRYIQACSSYEMS